MLVAAVGVAVLARDCHGDETLTPEHPDAATTLGEIVSPAENSAPTPITGQVWREVASAEPEAPPQLVAAELCQVRVWHAGTIVGEATCTAEGRYAVDASGPLAGATLVVEISVPGALRGVLTAIASPGVAIALPGLALGPASQLSGEVRSRSGQALPGVEVAALPMPSLGEPEPWRVVSNADGSFVLDTIPEGPVRLRATHPGHALTITDAFAPESGVVLVLDELLALHGAVIGDPEVVARAQVRLVGSSLWPPLQQAVDGAGSFAFPELVDGVYGLQAAVSARYPGDQEYASIPLENLGPGSEVGLALALAYRIPVRVISPDGAPVTGARVTVGYASIGLLQQVSETDPRGEAAVGPLVPGPYWVGADADGYLPSEPLQLDLGASPLPMQTLTLIRPGAIRGSVVDEDLRPVAAADIVITGENLYSFNENRARAGTFQALVRGGTLGVTTGTVPPIPLVGGLGHDDAGLSAHSDDAGEFRLDMLLPGIYKLRAVHRDHAETATVSVTLGPGQTREGVVLQLGRGVRLGGRLVDGNLRPLAGVRVELGDGSEVVTDSFGVFAAGYRRGRVRLVLRGPGLIPQIVELELGRADVEIERVMLPAEGVVTGRVRDGNGQAIAGVRVTLGHVDGLSPTHVTWTDDRGWFEMTELAPGAATLSLDHADYAPVQRNVRVPKAGSTGSVELQLVAGWTLALEVRARGTGTPIAGARIEIDGRMWSSDSSGHAEIRRLSGDKVRVAVHAGGWVGQTDTVPRPRDGLADFSFELDEAAGMEGEVIDERGEVVGGAKIVIRDADGMVLAEVVTTADGHWSAPDLPEGPVLVEALPPATLAELLAPVTVRSDVRRGFVTREVDLKFDRR